MLKIFVGYKNIVCVCFYF